MFPGARQGVGHLIRAALTREKPGPARSSLPEYERPPRKTNHASIRAGRKFHRRTLTRSKRRAVEKPSGTAFAEITPLNAMEKLQLSSIEGEASRNFFLPADPERARRGNAGDDSAHTGATV